MATRCSGVKVLERTPKREWQTICAQMLRTLSPNPHVLPQWHLSLPNKKVESISSLHINGCRNNAVCFQALILSSLGTSVSFLLEAICHVISGTTQEHLAQIKPSHVARPCLKDEKPLEREKEAKEPWDTRHVSREVTLEMHLVAQLPQMTSHGPETNLPTNVFPSSWHTKLWVK